MVKTGKVLRWLMTEFYKKTSESHSHEDIQEIRLALPHRRYSCSSYTRFSFIYCTTDPILYTHGPHIFSQLPLYTILIHLICRSAPSKFWRRSSFPLLRFLPLSLFFIKIHQPIYPLRGWRSLSLLDHLEKPAHSELIDPAPLYHGHSDARMCESPCNFWRDGGAANTQVEKTSRDLPNAGSVRAGL